MIQIFQRILKYFHRFKNILSDFEAFHNNELLVVNASPQYLFQILVLKVLKSKDKILLR